jgi:hypothetical protein
MYCCASVESPLPSSKTISCCSDSTLFFGDRGDELRGAGAFDGALRRLAVIEFPIASRVS